MTIGNVTRRSGFALIAATFVVVGAVTAAVAQEVTHTITVRDGKFEPSTLEVKAGTKFKLVVNNQTGKSVEFESAELNREKVIAAGASGTLSIGPLKAGTYPFFDEFNEKNRGQIVAK